MNKGNDANFTSLDSSDLYGDVFSNTDPITEVVTSNEVIKDPDYSSVDDAFSPKQDVILEVLKAKNVDPNSIKFENENGEIEERTWSELSFEEQKNIIVSNDLDVDYGLEEDEINIINDFRESKLSYQDYLQNIKKQAIEEYSQEYNPYQVSTIDDYTDDELYLLDLKNRTPDFTDEELILALETEKINESLFSKKITGLRKEYKSLEEQKIQAEQELTEQENARLVEGFQNTIKESVSNITSIGNLQLSSDEKTNIYNFITGTDSSGERLISSALNDPEKLVRMAWFALYGEQGFNVIQDYFTKELANSRKSKSSVVYTDKNTKENKTTDKPKINSMGSLYNLD